MVAIHRGGKRDKKRRKLGWKRVQASNILNNFKLPEMQISCFYTSSVNKGKIE